MARSDLDPLRAAGLDDRAIVDANQVVAYFNYVNRIAHGLGVELEARWPDAVRAERDYPLARTADDIPRVSAAHIPWLTVEQMREVDRLMVEEIGISLPRMMENAGRNLADLARRLLGGSVVGKRVVVLAGPGGNGGGGMVAARHLAGAGADVAVVLSVPGERLSTVTAEQYHILRQMGLPVRVDPEDRGDVDLVLDALLGYGQRSAPGGGAARLIQWCQGRRVVSLDVPSGLELSTGLMHDPHVRAEATLTLALPKEGMRPAGSAVGKLYLADISVPRAVYQRMGLDFESPFAQGPVVLVG